MAAAEQSGPIPAFKRRATEQFHFWTSYPFNDVRFGGHDAQPIKQPTCRTIYRAVLVFLALLLLGAWLFTELSQDGLVVGVRDSTYTTQVREHREIWEIFWFLNP